VSEAERHICLTSIDSLRCVVEAQVSESSTTYNIYGVTSK